MDLIINVVGLVANIVGLDTYFFISYIRLFMNDRVHQVGGENGRKKRLL